MPLGKRAAPLSQVTGTNVPADVPTNEEMHLAEEILESLFVTVTTIKIHQELVLLVRQSMISQIANILMKNRKKT